MSKLRIITVVVLAAAIIPLAAGAEQSDAPAPFERCYARLLCYGNIALAGEPTNFVGLLSYFFRVPIGETLPSIGTLRTDLEARFLQFEKECNARRYALTPLPTGQSAAWAADTREMYATLESVCMDGSVCSQIGEPCEAGSQCCSPTRNRCDVASGTCQQRNVVRVEE